MSGALVCRDRSLYEFYLEYWVDFGHILTDMEQIGMMVNRDHLRGAQVGMMLNRDHLRAAQVGMMVKNCLRAA